MSIEKEPVSFIFNYTSVQSKKSRLKFKISLFFILTAYIVIMSMYFHMLKVEKDKKDYQEIPNIVGSSSQINQDIQNELNAKPRKINYIYYKNKPLNNIKNLSANLKKRNTHVDILTSETKITTNFSESDSNFVNYTVTVPYLEINDSGKNKLTSKKEFTYKVFQYKSSFEVYDISFPINTPLKNNKISESEKI